jgi:uncharacterized repeat protein (TIGR01451 family)
MARAARLLAFAVAVVAASPAAAQLTLAIEANPGVAQPGEQLEIRITVSNQTPLDVGGVVLNLPLPAGLDNFNTVSAEPPATGCNQIVNNGVCQSGETLIWGFGTIEAGESVSASVAPTVSAGALGPIAFNPVLNVPALPASATVMVNAALALDVSLHEAADPVAASGELVYTLHFGNRSTITASPGALLRLPLPAGTVFVGASDGGALNGSNVEWALGTLQPGQSGTRSVTLETSALLVDGALLLANAELSDLSAQVAQARAVTEVDAVEPLALALSVNPDPAAVGEQLEIELTVSNRSASPLATVTLVLRWPQQTAPLFMAQATGAPSGCTQVVFNSTCTPSEFTLWTVGTLEPGQSATFSVSANVAAAPDGALIDFAASALSSNLDDRAEATRAIAVDSTSALDVGLHEAAEPVPPGDDVVYTLHFGNRSTTTAAPGAVLRLPLPAGTAFVGASDGGALNGSTVEWSLGTLQPGQSGTRSVTLESDAGLPDGTLLETEATLSDTSLPPQLARARELTELDALEALELSMALGPDPAAVGEQLDIELTVSNRSAASFGVVTVVLRWPQQIDPLFTTQGTSSPGGCSQVANDGKCAAGEYASWNLGTLSAGQSITLSYSADLAAAPDGGVVEFEALVDSSPGHDRAAAGRAIAVDAASGLDLALHEARDPVAAGDDLVYTLRFGNRSTTDPAPNALLRLPLPPGTSFVAASDGGAPSGGTVQWSLGTLQPGQSGERTVTLASDAGLLRGSQLRAEATLSDSSAPAQRALAPEVTEIDGLGPLAIAMALGPDPAAVGEQLRIELTVSNTGASPLPTPTLWLRWPHSIDSLFRNQGTGTPSDCSQGLNDGVCSAGEYTTWSLATLNAGESITLSYSADLAATPNGGVVDFEAFAIGASNDDCATVGRAIAVDSSRPLELGLVAAQDPGSAGDDVVYTLHFANTTTASPASSLSLRFPLPAGTSFVSATGGGALSGDTVVWSLGTLPPGVWSSRSVTVDTNAALPRASVLRADAALSDAAAHQLRAHAVTELDGLEALEAAVVSTVKPDSSFQIDATVTNTDVVTHGSVVLSLRIPRYAVPFSPLTVTGATPSGCNQITSNGLCEPGEFVFFNLTLTAGQSVTATIPSLSYALPAGKSGALPELEAIVLGSGLHDRAVDHVVPEPGAVLSLVSGIGCLAALARRRRRH